MNTDDLIQVPEDICSEVEMIVETIKKAAQEDGKNIDEIKIISPNTLGLNEAEIIGVFLFIGGSALTWLTDKWLETYVWPIIKKKIDPQSKKAVNWILHIVQTKVRQ